MVDGQHVHGGGAASSKHQMQMQKQQQGALKYAGGTCGRERTTDVKIGYGTKIPMRRRQRSYS